MLRGKIDWVLKLHARSSYSILKLSFSSNKMCGIPAGVLLLTEALPGCHFCPLVLVDNTSLLTFPNATLLRLPHWSFKEHFLLKISICWDIRFRKLISFKSLVKVAWNFLGFKYLFLGVTEVWAFVMDRLHRAHVKFSLGSGLPVPPQMKYQPFCLCVLLEGFISHLLAPHLQDLG